MLFSVSGHCILDLLVLIMKKLLGILVLGLLWSNVALAVPFIDTTWAIKKFVGESIFMEPEFIIGKEIIISKLY